MIRRIGRRMPGWAKAAAAGAVMLMLSLGIGIASAVEPDTSRQEQMDMARLLATMEDHAVSEKTEAGNAAEKTETTKASVAEKATEASETNGFEEPSQEASDKSEQIRQEELSAAQSPDTSAESRTDYIGETAAEEAALSDAGIQRDSAEYMFCHLDWDDGIHHYDVEFVSAGMEYEYEIGAEDGSVLEKSAEVADGTFLSGKVYASDWEHRWDDERWDNWDDRYDDDRWDDWDDPDDDWDEDEDDRWDD